jgi:hypothetical protein
MVDEHGVRTGALMRATLPGRMDADQTIGTLSPFHFSSFLFRASTCKTTVLAMPLRKTVSLDTGMFAVVADKGYLLNAGGVMSADRKHDGGITNTATHKGMRFHQNRILLWLFMDRHMGYRHSSRCQEVMADHWKHVRWETTRRQRLSLVLEQIRSVPGWFLRHPKVAVQRIMDVVKR